MPVRYAALCEKGSVFIERIEVAEVSGEDSLNR